MTIENINTVLLDALKDCSVILADFDEQDDEEGRAYRKAIAAIDLANSDYPHKLYSAAYWQTRHALIKKRFQEMAGSFQRIHDLCIDDPSAKALTIKSTCKAEIKKSKLEKDAS